MNEDLLHIIYDAYNLSSKGTFDEFKNDMSNYSNRKNMFDILGLSSKGTFEEFNRDLTGSSLSDNQRNLLDTVADKESNDYNVIVGGGKFDDYSQHPNVVGIVTAFGPSTAAGKYQITKSTWDIVSKRLGLTDFSPESQDQAALYLAQERFKSKTGKDLDTALESNNPNDIEEIRGVLGGSGKDTLWQGLQGDKTFTQRYNERRGLVDAQGSAKDPVGLVGVSYAEDVDQSKFDQKTLDELYVKAGGKPGEAYEVDVKHDDDTLLGMFKTNRYNLSFKDKQGVKNTRYLDKANAGIIDKFDESLVNIGINTVNGLVNMAGAIVGVTEDAVEAVLTGDKNFDKTMDYADNAVNDWLNTQKLKETTSDSMLAIEEKARIAEENGEGFAAFMASLSKLGEAQYWRQEGADMIGSQLAFTGLGLGVTAATTGTKLGIGLSKVLSKVPLVSEKTAEKIVKLGVGSVINASGESVQEASTGYKEIKQGLLDKGLTEEEATKQAADAASEIFGTNFLMLMATNFIELKGLTDGISTNKNPIVRGIINLFVEGGSESIQEGLQTGATNYSKDKALNQPYNEGQDTGVFDSMFGDKDSALGGTLKATYNGLMDGKSEYWDSVTGGFGISGASGIPTSIRSVHQLYTQEKPIMSKVNNSLALSANDIYKTDEDGKLIYDSNNKPQIDPTKQLSAIRGMNTALQIDQLQEEALKNNNAEAVKVLQAAKIASIVHDHLSKGDNLDAIENAINNSMTKKEYEKNKLSEFYSYEDFKDIKKNILESSKENYNAVYSNPLLKNNSAEFKQAVYHNSVQQDLVTKELDKYTNQLEELNSKKEKLNSLQKEEKKNLESKVESLKAYKLELIKAYDKFTANKSKDTKETKIEEIKTQAEEAAKQGVPVEEILANKTGEDLTAAKEGITDANTQAIKDELNTYNSPKQYQDAIKNNPEHAKLITDHYNEKLAKQTKSPLTNVNQIPTRYGQENTFLQEHEQEKVGKELNKLLDEKENLGEEVANYEKLKADPNFKFTPDPELVHLGQHILGGGSVATYTQTFNQDNIQDPLLQKAIDRTNKVKEVPVKEEPVPPSPGPVGKKERKKKEKKTEIDLKREDIEKRRQEGENKDGSVYKSTTKEKNGLVITNYEAYKKEDGKKYSISGRKLTKEEFLSEYEVDEDSLDLLDGVKQIVIREVRDNKGKLGITVRLRFEEGWIDAEIAAKYNAELAALETKETIDPPFTASPVFMPVQRLQESRKGNYIHVTVFDPEGNEVEVMNPYVHKDIWNKAQSSDLSALETHFNLPGHTFKETIDPEHEPNAKGTHVASVILTEGDTVYYEVTPSEFNNKADEDKLDISIVSYIKNGKAVKRGTEGAERIVVSKVPATDSAYVATFKDVANEDVKALREAAYNKFKDNRNNSLEISEAKVQAIERTTVYHKGKWRKLTPKEIKSFKFDVVIQPWSGTEIGFSSSIKDPVKYNSGISTVGEGTMTIEPQDIGKVIMFVPNINAKTGKIENVPVKLNTKKLSEVPKFRQKLVDALNSIMALPSKDRVKATNEIWYNMIGHRSKSIIRKRDKISTFDANNKKQNSENEIEGSIETALENPRGGIGNIFFYQETTQEGGKAGFYTEINGVKYQYQTVEELVSLLEGTRIHIPHNDIVDLIKQFPEIIETDLVEPQERNLESEMPNVFTGTNLVLELPANRSDIVVKEQKAAKKEQKKEEDNGIPEIEEPPLFKVSDKSYTGTGAKEYIKERFSEIGVDISDISLDILKELYEVGDKKIWGAFYKGVVHLASDAGLKIGKHEAMHVLFNLFLNPKQKVQIYNELFKRFGKELGISKEEFEKELNKPIDRSSKFKVEDQINYQLKGASIILENLKQIQKWETDKSIDKKLFWNKVQQLGILKEQIELIKNSKGNTIEEKLTNFVANYSYTVEINTAKANFKRKVRDEITGEEYIDDSEATGENANYYSNLTVPGGTNYTENEIATPGVEIQEKPQGVPVKKGVQELFKQNPELANAVYEALGFKNKLKTTLGKELEYKDPYVPQSRLKSFKQYEVLNESGDNIGTVVVEYRGNETVILHPKLNVTNKGYGKDLYKLISSKFNVEVQEWSEGAIANSDSAKKMWDSLEKEGSAKRIINAEQGDNFRVLNYSNQITPQQKQQALQLYSQYLDTIFPNSKVKDIVYHTTYQEFKGDKFDKPSEQSLAKGADDGIYFSKNPNYYTDKGNKIASILDLKTPMKYSHGIFMNAIDASGYRKIEGSDGFITYIKEAKADLDAIKPQFPEIDPNDFSEEELKEIENNYQKELDNWKQLAAKEELVFATVFEPEQIHILGSKQDVEGFKSFIKSNTKTVRKGAITPSIKGHAQFSTDNGIGWFRSDDKINNNILDKQSNIDRLKEFLPKTILLNKPQEFADYGYILKSNYADEIGTILRSFADDKISDEEFSDRLLGALEEQEFTSEERVDKMRVLELKSLALTIKYRNLILSNKDNIVKNILKKESSNKFKLRKVNSKEDSFIIDTDYGGAGIGFNPATNEIWENDNKSILIKSDKNKQDNSSKTRRILEVQSDLFQKGRDKEDLILKQKEDSLYTGIKQETTQELYKEAKNKGKEVFAYHDYYYLYNNKYYSYSSINNKYYVSENNSKINTSENQFLQLLNKDNNWVTFFVKSIIQDSAKKGYEKILFPRLDTIIQIESQNRFKTYAEAEAHYKDENWKLEDEELRKTLKEYQEEFENRKIAKKDTKEIERAIINQKERIRSHQPTLLNTANFYEYELANRLDDIAGGNKNNRAKGIWALNQITDEFGNTWNEITIDKIRDLNSIKLKTEENSFYEKQSALIRLEEKLADAFEDYKYTGVLPDSFKKNYPETSNFLEKIFKFLLDQYHMLKGYLTDSLTMNDIFYQLDNNIFAKGYDGKRRKSYQETFSRNLMEIYGEESKFKVGNLESINVKKYTKFLVTSVFNNLLEVKDKNGVLISTPWLSDKFKNSKNPSKDLSDLFKKLPAEIDKRIANAKNDVIRNSMEEIKSVLNDPTFKRHILAEIKNITGYSASLVEEDTNEDDSDEFTNDTGEYSESNVVKIQNEDPNKSIKGRLRELLNRVVKYDLTTDKPLVDPLTGGHIMYDFEEVTNRLYHYLPNSLGKEDMWKKLLALSESFEDMNFIVRQIKGRADKITNNNSTNEDYYNTELFSKIWLKFGGQRKINYSHSIKKNNGDVYVINSTKYRVNDNQFTKAREYIEEQGINTIPPRPEVNVENLYKLFNIYGIYLSKDDVAKFTETEQIDAIKAFNEFEIFVQKGGNPFRKEAGKTDSIKPAEKLIELVVKYSPNLTDNVIYTIHRKKEFIVQMTNFLTKTVDQLKYNNKDFVKKYKNTIFHGRLPIHNLNATETRDWEVHYNNGTIKQGSIKGTEYNKFTLKDLISQNINFAVNETAAIKVMLPIFSDATSHAYMKVTNKRLDVIPGLLADTAIAELERIQYSIKNKTGFKNFDKNGKHFILLPFLERVKSKFINEKGELKHELDDPNLRIILETLIEPELKKQFELYTKKLIKLGILTQVDTFNELNGVKTKTTDITFTKGFVSQKANEGGAIKRLEEYFYNQYYYNTQFIPMLGGDPAFYKANPKKANDNNPEISVSIDSLKRIKEVHSPTSSGLYKDKNGKPKSVKKILYLYDVHKPSTDEFIDGLAYIHKIPKNLIDLYKKERNNPEVELTEEEKKLKKEYSGTFNYLHKFDENNISDAQKYNHPEFTLMVMEGHDKISAEERDKLRQQVDNNLSTDVTLEVLKPFVFNHEFLPSGEQTLVRPFQEKNSEFTLLPNLAYLTKDRNHKVPDENTNWNNYVFPNKAKMLWIMQGMGNPENVLDGISFESATKVDLDLNNLMSIDDVLNLDPNHIYSKVVTSSMDGYGLSNEVPADKQLDKNIDLGSQIKVLITEGLNEHLTINGKPFSPEELLYEFEHLHMKGHREQFNKLKEKTNTPEKVIAILKDAAIKLGKNVSTIIGYNKNVDGKPDVPIEIESTSNQHIINSLTKAGVSESGPGGTFVNVSSIGVEENLNINWKKDIDGNIIGIDHIECAAAINSPYIDALTDKYGVVTVKDVEDAYGKEIADKLLTLLAYRIPTEDKYSMYPLKIKYILPRSSGAALMLPKEATTITGLDFDVDKMFFIKYAFKTNIDFNNPELFSNFLKDINNVIDKDLGLKDLETGNPYVLTRDKFKELFDMALNEEVGNTIEEDIIIDYIKENIEEYKELLENKSLKLIESSDERASNRHNYKLDIMLAIAQTTSFAQSFTKPGSSDILKQEIDRFSDPKGDYANYDIIEDESNSQVTLPSTQDDNARKAVIGGSTIGVMANANKHHAIIQFANLKLKIPFYFSNKEYKTIGRRKDIENKRFIKDITASLLFASTEHIKTPLMDKLNISMDSVNALLAGIRLGIPFHELMVLINQPIIKQELEKHANSNSLIIDLKNSLSTLATLNKFDLSSIYSEDITVDKLDTLFNPKGISSRPIIKEDLVALNKFIELASIGEELFKIQLNTKFDTSNQFGPELLDNQVKLQKLQSLYQNLLTNSYFSNFEDVVPEVIYNNITQEWTIKPSKLLLNDSYIKIMIDQLNHFKSSFSFLQGPFVNMQKTLNEIVNTGKAFSTYEIKKINGEIYNAVAQKTLDNIADIITNVPTEWGNIRYNIKDKYKPFIEALTREIVFGKPVLKMFDNTIIGNTLSEKYKDIFEDMLGDPDTKVFAERLATYAYFTSGFKYTPQGFSRFVPNTFLTENPQGKKIRDLYNNFNIADSKLTDYELATLILFNNPTLAKRVTLKDDTSTVVNKTIPGYGSLPSSFTINPDSTFKYTDKEGNPIQYLSHTAYITVGGKDLKFEMLFERTGSIEGYYSAINLPGNSSIFSNYSQVDLGFYPDVAPDIIEINNEDISDKDDLEYTDYTEVSDELKQLPAGTKQLTTGNETISVKDVENNTPKGNEVKSDNISKEFIHEYTQTLNRDTENETILKQKAKIVNIKNNAIKNYKSGKYLMDIDYYTIETEDGKKHSFYLKPNGVIFNPKLPNLYSSTSFKENVIEESKKDIQIKSYQIDQYQITLQSDGKMFYKNGKEVIDETIQNKVLVNDGIINGTAKFAVFNKQKYFILESGKVVSSTGKTVEEGAHKENILKQEIKPCKLG